MSPKISLIPNLNLNQFNFILIIFFIQNSIIFSIVIKNYYKRFFSIVDKIIFFH
uniref:Uncharacterized protein n=1 Tax=Heterorhabditis bacteriophora TaxID=37862 RepID=A0A1I7WTM1_HETBA